MMDVRGFIQKLFLLILFVFGGHVFAGQKVWEIERSVVVNYGGGLQVQMQPDGARDSPVNSFIASSSSFKSKVVANFKGVCSEIMGIEVWFRRPDKTNIEKFFDTRSITDLPGIELVDALRKSLTDQCEMLQVVRANYKFFDHRFNIHPDNHYVGTMTKDNDWELQDGQIETEYDKALIFEINASGVRFRGSCEEDPVLTIGPVYTSRVQVVNAKPPELYYYEALSKLALGHYLRSCPNTQSMGFKLTTTPKDYVCQFKDIDKCLIVTKKSDKWSIITSAFILQSAYDLIRDFKDMSKYLAEGDFAVVKEHASSGYFRLYYETFINVYSDYCGSLIKNPVKRQIVSYESSPDGFGGRIIKENGRKNILVEQKYVDHYDRYYDANKVWAKSRGFSQMVKRRGYGATRAVFGAVGQMINEKNDLRRIIENHCNSSRVQDIYENMYRYGENRPAITKKAITSGAKKAIAKFDNSYANKHGIFITTAMQYHKGVKYRCGGLPYNRINKGIHHDTYKGNTPLSEQEVVELFGDVQPAFGVRGLGEIYITKEKKVFDISNEVKKNYPDIYKLVLRDDFPVICGK